MNRTLLPGLTAIALTLGCFSAQAMPTDDATLMRLFGAKELAGGRAAATEFVVGRAVPSPSLNHTVRVSETQVEAESASYYQQDAQLAFLLAGLGVAAFAGAVLLAKVIRKRKPEDVVRPEGWREHLFEMLEADLMNMENLVQGPTRR